MPVAVLHDQLDFRDAGIAAHRNAADRFGDTRAVCVAGDPRTRDHRRNGFGRKARVAGFHGRDGHPIRFCHPEILVFAGQHFDVAEHFDPIGRIPAGDDNAQRKAIEQWQRSAVHRKGNDRVVAAGNIDGNRFDELRRALDRWAIQPFETNEARIGSHSGLVEDIAQPHPAPLRIGHRARPPLRTRDARLEQAATVARALVDGVIVDMFARAQDLIERQRERALHGPVNRDAISLDIDARREIPVPAHVMLVVRGQQPLIENRKRRLQ